jgi:5-methylcytosine-specific restriction endonuclease McrA
MNSARSPATVPGFRMSGGALVSQPLGDPPMSWEGSDRRSRLPSDWASAIVPRILQRDGYRCRIGYDGCTGTATEVDHIRRGDDHSNVNLQAACSWCHGKKSSAEGNAARRRWSSKRKPERHPGLLA